MGSDIKTVRILSTACIRCFVWFSEQTAAISQCWVDWFTYLLHAAEFL